MAGHTHQNYYFKDSFGIHHMLLPAILETPPGSDAYGWIDVYEDQLVVTGVGDMASLDLPISGAQGQGRKSTLRSALMRGKDDR